MSQLNKKRTRQAFEEDESSSDSSMITVIFEDKSPCSPPSSMGHDYCQNRSSSQPLCPQRNDLSLLETLPSDLFQLMCSYLSIKEKCCSISAVNRAVGRSFVNNLSACCNGWLTLNLPSVSQSYAGLDLDAVKQSIMMKCANKLKYLSHTKRLCVNLSGPHVDDSTMVRAIKQSIVPALQSGLTSLYIKEHCATLPRFEESRGASLEAT